MILSDEIRKLYGDLFNSNPEERYITWDEIEILFSAITSLKENDEKNWNNLTFDKFIKSNPAFSKTVQTLIKNISEKAYDKWIERVFSRLTKEKLLGENLKPLYYNETKKLLMEKNNETSI